MIEIAGSAPLLPALVLCPERLGRDAAACHIEIKITDTVPDDVAVHFLGNACKGAAFRAVLSAGAPAPGLTAGATGRKNSLSEAEVMSTLSARKCAVGVGRIEETAIFRSQRPAPHFKTLLPRSSRRTCFGIK